jgi:hypothetical protein
MTTLFYLTFDLTFEFENRVSQQMCCQRIKKNTNIYSHLV